MASRMMTIVEAAARTVYGCQKHIGEHSRQLPSVLTAGHGCQYAWKLHLQSAGLLASASVAMQCDVCFVCLQ
jgi:hypothetical protein